MSPEEFKLLWKTEAVLEEKLVPWPATMIEGCGLSGTTQAFLIESGLPEDAAPFLSFKPSLDERGVVLLSVREIYPHLDSGFACYTPLGSDGSGNPIVVDSADNDRICRLDHEDSFSSHPINSSIETLAGFLLIYRDFNQRLLTENGEDAVMDSNFSDLQFNELKETLIKVDDTALNKGTFWYNELEELLANREFYREESKQA